MENDELKVAVQKARDGDIDVFAEVFESMRPVVTAIACRLVGPDDADDVVMETYLKAWKAVTKFNQRSSLKTWLYRVTHNCAMDFLRARKRRQDRTMPEDEHDDRTIADIADEAQATPDELLEKSETAAMVRAALDRLDENHRTTLMLRFSDGLSYADIAAATGVSIGTVMSRLFNGKRKLMKILRS